MNNRTIDLKAVLFTLDQLQHTLDILTGAQQPVMQGEYHQQPALNPGKEDSTSPLPVKSRS